MSSTSSKTTKKRAVKKKRAVRKKRATKKAPSGPEAVVAMSSPQLWRFEFERGDNVTLDKMTLEFAVGLSRMGREKLGIEFVVKSVNVPGLELTVAYRAIFNLQSEDLKKDLEDSFRTIAAHIAPSALYPFVRETIAGAIVKAGLRPVALPVISFRNAFDPEKFEIPPYEEGD